MVIAETCDLHQIALPDVLQGVFPPPLYYRLITKHIPVTHFKIPACDLPIGAVPSAVPFKRHHTCMTSYKDYYRNTTPGPCLLIWLPVHSIYACVWKSEWEGDTVPCPCGLSRCTSVHMSFWSHTHLAYPGQDQVASHETLSQKTVHRILVCCKDEKDKTVNYIPFLSSTVDTRKRCIQAECSRQRLSMS